MTTNTLNLNKVLLLSSLQNPIVKSFAALKQPRQRRISNFTLVEGFQILNLAIEGGFYPHTLFYTPHTATKTDLEVVQRAYDNGADVFAVTDKVMLHVSQREGPLGCVATVPIQYTPLEQVKCKPDSIFLLGESLEKPGNIGALIRTASAAGADGVIIVDPQTDGLAPACIHASLGAIFALPLVKTTTPEALAWLKKNKIQCIATSPDAKKHYFDINMTGPICVAVGNEHRGLSQAWLGDKTTPVRIPMSGPMNSLNATSAGAIVLFDAVRQRFAEQKS